jgi:hypothetical protein
MIKYDSLTVSPVGLVKSKYMAAYLNVKQNDLFSYDQVIGIDNAIQKMPFVRLSEPVQLQFANNLCNISFGLEKIKSNRFDAIIGFLPNQGSNSGLRITGYADLHLDNLFKAGKSLTFQWQQFQPLSQKLLLDYKHPNLFRSPLGVELQANLIRQDSAFLNTNLVFDVFYTRQKVEVAILSNITSSRQLANPADTTNLPTIADYGMRLFGLDFVYNNIANLLNGTSVMRLQTSVQFGSKTINKNPNLSETVYDSIDLSTNQLQLNLEAAFNKRLSRSFALNAQLHGGLVLNSDRLFVNDLLRLGGVQSLRGFNELELFVSSYGLARLEFRLLMSEASRLFLFYDQAFTYNEVDNYRDAPLGFGAGIKLATAGGDLQLVYALGVSQQQSLSLDQSKIHLGYVATF